jgi:hypothetical protein
MQKLWEPGSLPGKAGNSSSFDELLFMIANLMKKVDKKHL